MEKTAIIVARKGSKRIKSKSLLELNGKSLIERKIKQLQQCKLIDRIVFGSDSDEMISIAKLSGAETIKRADYYCDEEKASANEMIKEMMDLVESDVIIWSHCTNPLLTSNTYDNAIQTFLNNLDKGFDSLLSVHEIREHLWTTDKKPYNYNPYSPRHIPARDLPPMYMQDGGIFIQPYKNMKQNCYFFGTNPYLYVIPEKEFLDINNYRDYIIAKALMDSKQ